MIAWWPDKIESDQTTDHMSAFWDVMPTIAELVGANVPDGIDGISFLPTLIGSEIQKEHPYLYWEFHERRGRQAVRQGDWKLLKYNVFQPENTTIELYHIPSDPEEKQNVAKENKDIVDKLLETMKHARIESELFEFKIK
jgi:arylsulfatase A-like enzyme